MEMKMQGTPNDIHSFEPTFGRYSFYFVVDGCNRLDSIDIERQPVLISVKLK